MFRASTICRDDRIRSAGEEDILGRSVARYCSAACALAIGAIRVGGGLIQFAEAHQVGDHLAPVPAQSDSADVDLSHQRDLAPRGSSSGRCAFCRIAMPWRNAAVAPKSLSFGAKPIARFMPCCPAHIAALACVPANQSGGCGCWTGVGWMKTFGSVVCSLS